MQAVMIYKAFAKVYPLLFEEKYKNKYIYFSFVCNSHVKYMPSNPGL